MRWRGRYVDREVASAEIASLFDVTVRISEEQTANLAEFENEHRFPAHVYGALGQAGLMGLPYSEQYGGAELSAEVSLQVLEELAYDWLAIGIGVSVHNLACFPLASVGSSQQRADFLPSMLSGERMGAYCLSEPHSGSDAAALITRAEFDGSHYVVNGRKAWITHGEVADVFAVMVRTSGAGPRGISCLLIDASMPGVRAEPAERKMGNMTSPTNGIVFDQVRVPADRLIGGEGEGFIIALQALDSGRLGIAACAVGLAQAALDYATRYAQGRVQFGQPIARFQGVSFTLADMAADVYAARCAYLDAARRKDAGLAFSTQAAMAKLVATDAAMRVASAAVSVLGGAGYTSDHPVERYFREAKALQIVEGTNQIQRLVIGRHLTEA